MATDGDEVTMSDELNAAIKDALKAMTMARTAAGSANIRAALDEAGRGLAAACVAAGGGAQYPGE